MVHRGTSENRGSGDQQRRLTVLLVEDSQLLAARLSELLEHIGNIQLVGPVATESLALSSARQNKPDVIILDLHLREGTGFGVLRGLLLLLVVALVAGWLQVQDAPWWRQSQLAPWLQVALKGMRPVLPEALGRHLPS